MTALQLKPCYPRPTFYRKPVKTFANNWLNQQFNVQAKNQVWPGDMTYVYTALCEQALRLAIQRRASETGLAVSFGQRGRYSSRAFRQCLSDVGIKQSQSRAGKCTDNA
ncbi:transposase [Aggregatibacter actinomycetemcomitans]|uniref:Transposase n=2 Tax=Aggregatibacter actinomycetemcomitans TaxID=714 RepID=A0AAC8XWL5_AGGAC|nr:transposase [Aggregatibacter actinomycetemcomitans]ANN81598.1 transposase [Aggregatibacter actinomycetemcomitans D7S-1]KYK95249.1 transposase [Aggregatibacter actinomycetemcomitans serotype d str. SA3733]AMQ93280.1 transposase [Aggregatibacter actinomycetemcomitans]ANU81737.1 transposase [Aggregatibacter actinomycetemcomitans]KND85017.1 transposase [Aggregatibacter actinomycetemcomitans serotype a str. H5P1]